MPHLAGRADGVADERELMAAGPRLAGTEGVVEVDRVAADLIRADPHDLPVAADDRAVDRIERGAAHVTHFHVAEVDVGAVEENHVPARAARVLRADDDIAREVADVGEEGGTAVRAAGAAMIVLQRGGQRDPRPGDRCDFERLVLRLEGAAALAVAQLPGVGNDNPVSRRPAGRRLRQHERRLAGQCFLAQPGEGRRLGRAVHGDAAERLDAVAHLSRVESRVESLVSDDDLCLDALANRLSRRPDFEGALVHHRQVDDFHPRVDLRIEGQPPADLDARQDGIADDVVRDGATRRDGDLLGRARHTAGRPGGRARPGAIAHRDDGRTGAEDRQSARHPVHVQCVDVIGLGGRRDGQGQGGDGQRHRAQDGAIHERLLPYWRAARGAERGCGASELGLEVGAWVPGDWCHSSQCGHTKPLPRAPAPRPSPEPRAPSQRRRPHTAARAAPAPITMSQSSTRSRSSSTEKPNNHAAASRQ